jgi:hypothetical protein
MQVYWQISGVRNAPEKCVRKFLKYFKKGFKEEKYVHWERGYKEEAHKQFAELLGKEKFAELLQKKKYAEIAAIAIRIESKTNLLFSFEKMALRDAVKTGAGAKAFAMGLYDYIYGEADLQTRFENFVEIVASLPRKQTRVLTWPLVTVFGFIGNPKEWIFLKPMVTKLAAKKYQFDFVYQSKPNWNTYQSLLSFASRIKKDLKTMGLVAKDYIDLQSFIWVMGSEEYP